MATISYVTGNTASGGSGSTTRSLSLVSITASVGDYLLFAVVDTKFGTIPSTAFSINLPLLDSFSHPTTEAKLRTSFYGGILSSSLSNSSLTFTLTSSTPISGPSVSGHIFKIVPSSEKTVGFISPALSSSDGSALTTTVLKKGDVVLGLQANTSSAVVVTDSDNVAGSWLTPSGVDIDLGNKVTPDGYQFTNFKAINQDGFQQTWNWDAGGTYKMGHLVSIEELPLAGDYWGIQA